jgi:ABC-2 type transport system permease protein
MIATIAKRELQSLFLSPLAWVTLAVIAFIMAYVFLIQVQLFTEYQPRLAGLPSAPGVTEIVAVPMFSFAVLLLTLIAPLLTHRAIAGERRTGTLTLLQAAPVSPRDIVLGKWLALMGFLAIVVAIIAAMPASLALGTSPDWRHMAACMITLLLLLGMFTAIGIFISALVDEPIAAAMFTFGTLLLLKIIDWTAEVSTASTSSTAMHYLSMSRHLEPMLAGRFASTDVLYFLIFIALFLGLAIWRLEEDRLQR